jgi:hypothetical protein
MIKKKTNRTRFEAEGTVSNTFPYVRKPSEFPYKDTLSRKKENWKKYCHCVMVAVSSCNNRIKCMTIRYDSHVLLCDDQYGVGCKGGLWDAGMR